MATLHPAEPDFGVVEIGHRYRLTATLHNGHCPSLERVRFRIAPDTRAAPPPPSARDVARGERSAIRCATTPGPLPPGIGAPLTLELWAAAPGPVDAAFKILLSSDKADTLPQTLMLHVRARVLEPARFLQHARNRRRAELAGALVEGVRTVGKLTPPPPPLPPAAGSCFAQEPSAPMPAAAPAAAPATARTTPPQAQAVVIADAPAPATDYDAHLNPAGTTPPPAPAAPDAADANADADPRDWEDEDGDAPGGAAYAPLVHGWGRLPEEIVEGLSDSEDEGDLVQLPVLPGAYWDVHAKAMRFDRAQHSVWRVDADRALAELDGEVRRMQRARQRTLEQRGHLSARVLLTLRERPFRPATTDDIVAS